MELVRGVPINQFCDEKRLTVRQRLELLIQVCHAVQHAHQKGIIHRDLKPTNVLVTQHDALAVPKVIDFGIAKALGAQLTDHTLHTGFAQLIGTPLYMSPEQAEMNQFGVDTRSDVYSLGVMLYELLTGTTPFDKERLTKAGLDEMRRVIREEEPPRPSARLSTLQAQALSTISAHRNTDPRRISLTLRGELDWIVMKSLEKDRTRRYESASAFAADIQRYLSGDVVQACPPSAAYRFRKFAKKNKTALTTASLLAASLLLGTTLSLWQALRATAAEAQATANEDRAKESAAAEATQRKQAEQNFQVALEALDRMLASVSAEELNDIPRVGPLRRQLLRDALSFYERIAPRSDASAQARHQAAETWLRIATLSRSLNEHQTTRRAFATAITLMGRLVDEQPGETKYRKRLAEFHNLAGAYYLHDGPAQADKREAEKHFRRATEVWAALGIREETLRIRPHEFLRGLADALHSLAKREEAMGCLSRALDLLNSATHDDARFAYSRGKVLSAMGRVQNDPAPTEADEFFRRAIVEFRKFRQAGRSSQHDFGFAAELRDIARQIEVRHPEEAERLLEESIVIFRDACGPNPNTSLQLEALCTALTVEARLLRRLAKDKAAAGARPEAATLEQKAESLFQESLTRQRQCVSRFATAGSRPVLLSFLQEESNFLLRAPGQTSLPEEDAAARKLEADPLLTEAIQLCRALAAEFPNNADYKSRLATLLKLQAQHFSKKPAAEKEAAP